MLTWPTPAYLLIGVLVGYVVGVLPGFGASAAMALILPSVIALRPIDGFVLLTAVAALCLMAGDVTSILLGVPGEATAAAIVADGHAMARRGLGGVAVGAALTAAWLGAAIGAVLLAVFTPFARPLFSLLQSPELAALAVLGLCLVTPLARAHPAKGMAAGAFGIVLATIGLDPSLGEPRLTFGQLGLWDGLGLLPVALGLFAVPEALAMIRGALTTAAAAHPDRRGVIDGCVETLRRPGLVLRCGAIGAGIGVVPGVGASVSQWVAYAHAGQTSSPSSRFGDGAIEGVIGPATATTATFGGALIPTLVLGIPGSVTTTFLLSALTFKGLAPGPGLLLPEQAGGHLTLVWSLVWCIVLASLAGAVLSALSIGWVQALASTRPSRLFPFILTLVVIGTIGERRAVSDLGILAVIGLIGYTMSVLNWPRAPLMLGFVLGPLLERRWILSQAVYGWSSFLRPGVILLTVLAATFLYATTRSTASRSPGATRSERGDAAVAWVLALIALAGLWWMPSLARQAAAFPRVAFGALLACAIWCAWNFRHRPRMTTSDQAPRGTHIARLGWFAAFLGSVWLVGAVLGAALAAAAHGRVEARARWREVLAVSAAAGLVSHLLVSQLMHVSWQGAVMPWLAR